jgi:hypothetical protein
MLTALMIPVSCFMFAVNRELERAGVVNASKKMDLQAPHMAQLT